MSRRGLRFKRIRQEIRVAGLCAFEFCDDHPMAYRLQQSGSDIIVLRIKIDVALLKGTLFSDINAADKLHTHGGSLEDLKG